MGMRIEYVDYGIGSVDGCGVVSLNRRLKDEPHVHRRVLAHELGHSRGEAYTVHDFFHDMRRLLNGKRVS